MNTFRIVAASLLTLSLLTSTAIADHPKRPVKSATDALSLAKHWAAEAKMVGFSVGEVKTLSLLYAVDIVDADEPDLHANHLIIRKEDGFAVLVYPAHDAPKLSREHRLGLDGLAGMSGMTGVSSAKQAKASSVVQNDVEARRHVDSWLNNNGMEGLYSLEDVTSMNNVYVVDLYERKAHRLVNQAIVRGVDGYVSVVRDIKLPAQQTTQQTPTAKH